MSITGETPISSNNGVAETTISALIIGHKLNKQNYLQWSNSAMMFVEGKGKDLTSVATNRKEDDPKLKTWKDENSMIKSWLINLMTNDIREDFMLYDLAQEIWVIAKDMYSDLENTVASFGIEGILEDLRKEAQFVTQYFTLLTRYWQQLDTFEKHEWSCRTNAAAYKKIVEKKRIYKFLLSLNKNLDEVRGRILAIKPLPNILEVFREREKSQRKLLLGSTPSLSQIELSTLPTRNSKP